MMRRLLNKLNDVLPPWWAIIFAVAVYAVVEGLYIYFAALFAVAGMGPPEELIRIRIVAALLISSSYAIYRAIMFHPAFRPSYRGWLETTPWRAGLPLPLGPIHFCWQDVFVLAGLSALLWHTFAPLSIGAVDAAASVVAVTFVCYLPPHVFAFRALGQWKTAYLVGFGWGLAVFVLPSVLGLCILSICYAVTVVGIWSSLVRFPWDGEKLKSFMESADRSFRRQAERLHLSENTSVGWPFAELAPRAPDAEIGYRDTVLFPLLGGWCAYAVFSHVDFLREPAQLCACFLILGGTLPGVLSRLLVYLDGSNATMSIFGRLATRRLIVPGFDKVFLAPICAMLLAAAVWTECARLQWSILSAGIMSLVGASLVLSNFPPTLANWRVTGTLRLTAPGTRRKMWDKI